MRLVKVECQTRRALRIVLCGVEMTLCGQIQDGIVGSHIELTMCRLDLRFLCVRRLNPVEWRTSLDIEALGVNVREATSHVRFSGVNDVQESSDT